MAYLKRSRALTTKTTFDVATLKGLVTASGVDTTTTTNVKKRGEFQQFSSSQAMALS